MEVYYSDTWSGRAQRGVAELEHLGNYPGVICQSVRVFHYICQPHKQVDKIAVIQWKKITVLSLILNINIIKFILPTLKMKKISMTRGCEHLFCL